MRQVEYGPASDPCRSGRTSGSATIGTKKSLCLSYQSFLRNLWRGRLLKGVTHTWPCQLRQSRLFLVSDVQGGGNTMTMIRGKRTRETLEKTKKNIKTPYWHVSFSLQNGSKETPLRDQVPVGIETIFGLVALLYGGEYFLASWRVWSQVVGSGKKNT